MTKETSLQPPTHAPALSPTPGAPGREPWATDLLRGTSAAPPTMGDEHGRRELKVKIPARMHMKLHSLRLIKGQSLSSTVEAALAEYFARQAHARAAAAHGAESSQS